MKLRLISLVLFVQVWGCKPESFYTNLGGYSIQFPATLAELQKAFPKGYRIDNSRFADSSQKVKVEWLFNTWGGATGNHDPQNQPFGIVMIFKDKKTPLDSVKAMLERQYHKPLKPLVFTETTGDFSKVEPIYASHISKAVFLVLRKSNRLGLKGLRISIGYHLTKKQEESFALLEDIYDDKL